MRFCNSYFENRWLTLVLSDSTCSCWLLVATSDSSYGWFPLRRLIQDLQLNWPPSGFWPWCPPDSILFRFIPIPLNSWLRSAKYIYALESAKLTLSWASFTNNTNTGVIIIFLLTPSKTTKLSKIDYSFVKTFLLEVIL